jgi:hypothetical protein
MMPVLVPIVNILVALLPVFADLIPIDDLIPIREPVLELVAALLWTARGQLSRPRADVGTVA